MIGGSISISEVSKLVQTLTEDTFLLRLTKEQIEAMRNGAYATIRIEDEQFVAYIYKKASHE
jgi:hypothetical protein